MGTLTVRMSQESHAKLREMAEETEQPMVTILEKAIEAYRRQQFLKRANDEFARLRRNKRAWKEEEKERKAWDAALRDGLENE